MEESCSEVTISLNFFVCQTTSVKRFTNMCGFVLFLKWFFFMFPGFQYVIPYRERHDFVNLLTVIVLVVINVSFSEWNIVNNSIFLLNPDFVVKQYKNNIVYQILFLILLQLLEFSSFFFYYILGKWLAVFLMMRRNKKLKQMI